MLLSSAVAGKGAFSHGALAVPDKVYMAPVDDLRNGYPQAFHLFDHGTLDPRFRPAWLSLAVACRGELQDPSSTVVIRSPHDPFQELAQLDTEGKEDLDPQVVQLLQEWQQVKARVSWAAPELQSSHGHWQDVISAKTMMHASAHRFHNSNQEAGHDQHANGPDLGEEAKVVPPAILQLPAGKQLLRSIPQGARKIVADFMRKYFVSAGQAARNHNYSALTDRTLELHKRLADCLVASSNPRDKNKLVDEILASVERAEAEETGRQEKWLAEQERLAQEQVQLAADEEIRRRDAGYASEEEGGANNRPQRREPLPAESNLPPLFSPAVTSADILRDPDAPQMTASETIAQQKADLRTVRQVVDLLERGHAVPALRLAMRSPALRPATNDPEDPIIKQILAMHPFYDLSDLPPLPSSFAPLQLSSSQLLKALQKADSAAAPGPSGIGVSPLRQLCETDSVICDAMASIVEVLANGNWRDHRGHAFITAGLTAVITKKAAIAPGAAISGTAENEADAGELLRELLGLNMSIEREYKPRPLTCIESLLKISDHVVWSLVDPQMLAKSLGDTQLAIGIKGGTERYILRCQKFLIDAGAKPDTIVLFLDIANAFMHCDRAKMLKAVYALEELRPIWGLARWHLSRPNVRYLRCADGSVFTFYQYQGGPQGDVLMPVLFAACISVLHKRLLELHPTIALHSAYLDDTSAGDQIRTMEAFFKDAEVLAPELCGFHLNKAKTIALTVAPNPDPDLLRAAKDNNWEVHYGHTGIVGGVVGTDTAGMINFIVRKVRAHEPMFRVLTHAQMHKQTALKLLRLALLPSMNHLLRAHDPTITLKGAKLMDDAVLAAYVQITQSPEVLTSPTLQAQLHLPTSKGGMGLASAQTTAPCASAAALMAATGDTQLFPPPHPAVSAPSPVPPVPHHAAPDATNPSASAQPAVMKQPCASVAMAASLSPTDGHQGRTSLKGPLPLCRAAPS